MRASGRPGVHRPGRRERLEPHNDERMPVSVSPTRSADSADEGPKAQNIWRTSTAEAEGVDPAGIRDLVDELDADAAHDPHALIVLRHGAMIASAAWAPYVIDRPQLVYSLSKSFTSTAAGFAAAEGLLDLDAPAADYFPEYADSVAPASRGILVRHLASMATGHLNDMIVAFGADRAHPIRAFLATPPEREPGSVFTYNQLATYTLGAIVQRQSGTVLTEYLRPRLLEPLGIGPLGWQQQPAGVDLGFSGLFASPEAVAKLGQLYLGGGRWGARRLLPEWWVREATGQQVANAVAGDPAAADSDWQQGYGFQFWVSRHGFRGDGAFGQFCLVLPEHDAVVAITSQTVDTQDLLDRVWRHLLPAFRDVPLRPQPGGGESLHRIERSIPFPGGLHALGELGTNGEGDYLRADDAESREAYTALTRVTLHRTADGWHVTLHEDSGADADGAVTEPWAAAITPVRSAATPTGTVTGRIGETEWAVTEGDEAGGLEVPVAVRGGTIGSGAARVDIAFVDTPHRLTLWFDAAARTVTPRWTTQALGFAGAYQLRAVRPGETFVVER